MSLRGLAVYAGVLALASIIFLIVPQIDLATSRLFYVAGRGFALTDWPPVVFLYRAIPWVSWGVLAFAAAATAWLALIGQPLWRLDGRALIFIIASVALGSGFFANTVLKDHWGRARPTQIEAFGGSRQFTPAPLPAAECPSNCAFVSGHAALGFSLIAFAFLLPAGPARRGAFAAVLAIGAIVGLGRIAQGAHFLSDVVYAGFLVYGTTALLYWLIIERDALAAPPLLRLRQRFRRGAAAGWAAASGAFRSPPVGVALAAGVTMTLIALSIHLIDRPLALFFHARDPDFRALFDLTGRLGLAYGYLTVFCVAFVTLHWGGSLPRLQPFARPMRAASAVPAFLFISIAASGLVVDLLKLVFGRLRPKLLFQSGAYDFGWLGLHADHWSFPSGHTATIVALMTALWALWPRHLLFYIAVAAIVGFGRIAVGAHYLSDVLAGALIAMLTTWGVASVFSLSGIDLGAARRGRFGSEDLPPWVCRRFGRGAIGKARSELQEATPVARADR